MSKSKVRFAEWTAPVLTEKDLPEGVRYKQTCRRDGDCAEFVAEFGGRSTCVRHTSGKEAHWHYGTRGNGPVRVLDWPDWTTPRPPTQPKTLGEVFDMVGTDGRVAAVVEYDGHIRVHERLQCEVYITIRAWNDRTDFTLLGFLVQD